MYKTAKQILQEKIITKNYYIPRLAFQDEMHLEYIGTLVTDLANNLNSAGPITQLLMFKTKREYNKAAKELNDFIDFWKFPIKNEVEIQKFYGTT